MARYSLREQKGNSFLEHMLHSRGIMDMEEKAAFLNPDYNKGTHDPYLLKDMQKVVDRIVRAIESNEKIFIYSDFDADGIPGAVVLHDFFKRISYENTEHYIPHRHRQGFGVHADALEEIAKTGATLVITIDCGIAEIENSKKAKELGIDLIITDHHTPGEELPAAYAIINPKQSDCQYPEKMLCGAGVIYKVVQALCLAQKKGDTDAEAGSRIFDITPGWEKWLLDMVGLATLSDMVPLRGENRIFAHYGLTVMRKSPRLGLVMLFKSMKMNQKHVTEEDIAFMITPRINAASRMADPQDAFRLLATKDEEEARLAVEHLNKINDDRKTQVAVLVKAMKKEIEERGLHEKPVIVLGNPDWKPPVLGLVATNIVRDYNRPAFLWGRSDEGVIKGSCRSMEGIDVVKIMRAMPEEMFLNMGGHVASGGFSVATDRIHEFEMRILEAYEKQYGAEASAEGGAPEVEVSVDKLLDPREVGRFLWSDIEKMSPFGEGNPKPLFMLKETHISDIRQFGKKKEHLEIVFTNPETGAQAKAIKFFGVDDAAFMAKLKIGESRDVVVHMEKSMFRNFPEYRLRVVDVL